MDTTTSPTAPLTPATSTSPSAESYGPVEHWFVDRNPPTTAGSLRSARLGFRMRRDPQLLLAIAIALPVLAIEGSVRQTLPWLSVVVPGVFVGLQVALAAIANPPSWLVVARLGLSLVFVAVANAWLDPSGSWPLSSLGIPVVALAASRGDRASVGIVLVGMALMLVPFFIPTVDAASRQEVLALTMATAVIAIGSRRVISNLERSTLRLRLANQRDRRHAHQLEAVESVGRVLAQQGPTAAALDQVMGLLETTFGYRYPSVYVWDGKVLHLGAQRNYQSPIQTLTPDRGVLGRIIRTGEPAFLPDARTDPDFLSADPNVISEIGIPLRADGELLGVLNVETSGERRLDADDLSMMEIVADRLAVALALGRERQKLTERTVLLDRFTSFAAVLSSTLDPDAMTGTVATGAAGVVSADVVTVVMLDEGSGTYQVAALHGGDPSVLGAVVKPGEGLSGRAIATRTVAVDGRLGREHFPKSMIKARVADHVAGLSAPMVVGDQVIGAVTWSRADLSRPFTPIEQEVAELLGGRSGLGLVNARLHKQMRDAAVTDPLTGVHNRRHFDATLERDDAVRRRIAAERRRRRSAILFDLDHFGKVNKQYGHQVGDRVLRLFADTLKARSRSSDLVARYGGEEFVVILDSASREDATALADAIRLAFADQTVETGTGERLKTTVSAGCSTLEQWEVEGSLLLDRADVALAMAKAGGRDQVVAA